MAEISPLRRRGIGIGPGVPDLVQLAVLSCPFYGMVPLG
jgi:hypothetical protein